MDILYFFQSHDAMLKKTEEILETLGNVSAEELSRNIGISVILAKERLLAAEQMGLACRDDTVEGLRFYSNRILLEA